MKRRAFFGWLGAASAAPLIPVGVDAAKAIEEVLPVAKAAAKPVPLPPGHMVDWGWCTAPSPVGSGDLRWPKSEQGEQGWLDNRLDR